MTGTPAPARPPSASSATADGASRSASRYALAAFTLALALAYLAATLAMPAPAIADPLGPQIFPLLVCAGLLLTATLLALEAWRAGRAPRHEAQGPPLAQSVRVVGALAGWTALYIACFEPVGFPIATTIFLAGLMRVFHGRLWTSLACATAFSAGAWVLFAVLLSVRLPAGLLPL